MDVKRRWTRIELTQTAQPGPYEWTCVLCHGMGFRLGDIKHDDSCPLADMSVTSVVVIKTRASVVFRFRQNRWWWTSAGGNKYSVEKLPGRYSMFDLAGNEIVNRSRLNDLRHWLALNQGRL